MNPLQYIPNKIRVLIYITYAIVGPILLYTKTKGLTGNDEIELWIGLGTATGITAAANVGRTEPVPGRHAAPPD